MAHRPTGASSSAPARALQSFTPTTTQASSIESQHARTYTLGELFTEWRVRLDKRCVGGYCRPDSLLTVVNGKRYSGNPADLVLKDRQEIAIVIVSPPEQVPNGFPPLPSGF